VRQIPNVTISAERRRDVPGRGGASRPVRVEVEARTGYELLMSLVTYEDAVQDEAGTIEEAVQWLAEVRRAAPERLLAAVRAFSSGSGWVWGNLTPVVSEAPEPRDAEAVLEHIRGTDALELRLHLLGHYLRPFRRETAPEISRAAALGDETSAAQLLATSFPDAPLWADALRALLPLDADETKRRLMEILVGWNEHVFRHHEGRLMPVLERDAATKRALARLTSTQRVIETATNGWDYVPEPGIERILLVPSVMLRPWVLTADHRELRIFCYPVPDEAFSEEGEPPARLVRQLRALADARRLRLLKRLAAGPAPLHELAREFAMPKTTVLHHLVLLRSAGLVRLHDSSERQYSPHAGYHIRAEVIGEVYRGLLAYLDVPQLPERPPTEGRA
jgi:DNA-binding transcriptional ArsR family regulator